MEAPCSFCKSRGFDCRASPSVSSACFECVNHHQSFCDAQGITAHFTDAAVDWLAEHGYQPEYGARPLRRTIQREVDNHLSRLLLDGTVAEGSEVTVDVSDGHLEFRPAKAPL